MGTQPYTPYTEGTEQMSGTKITMPYGTGKTVLSVEGGEWRVELSKGVKACSNCRWHENFSGACCNGDSEYRADFTDNDFVYDKWEERK